MQRRSWNGREDHRSRYTHVIAKLAIVVNAQEHQEISTVAVEQITGIREAIASPQRSWRKWEADKWEVVIIHIWPSESVYCSGTQGDAKQKRSSKGMRKDWNMTTEACLREDDEESERAKTSHCLANFTEATVAGETALDLKRARQCGLARRVRARSQSQLPAITGKEFLMSKGTFCQVTLLGNLGKDPELKYTAGGTAVTKFSMATTSSFKDKQGGWQDQTEWHNVVAYWAATAENLAKYCARRRPSYSSSAVRKTRRTWEDKGSGKRMYMTSYVVESFCLIGKRDGGQSQDREEHNSAPAGRQHNSEITPDHPITDDDIPF